MANTSHISFEKIFKVHIIRFSIMKRLALLLLCCLFLAAAVAQEKKRKKPASPAFKEKKAKEDAKFLNKQWWLGLKGGGNLSKVSVEKMYSAISPTNYEPST